MRKCIGTIYFSDSRGTIGIVISHDKMRVENEYRAFIGIVKDHESEKETQEHIMNYGAKFSLFIARDLITTSGCIYDPELFQNLPI